MALCSLRLSRCAILLTVFRFVLPWIPFARAFVMAWALRPLLTRGERSLMIRIFNLVSNLKDCHRKSPITVGASGGRARCVRSSVWRRGNRVPREHEQNGWRMGAFPPPTHSSQQRRALFAWPRERPAVFSLVGLGGGLLFRESPHWALSFCALPGIPALAFVCSGQGQEE